VSRPVYWSDVAVQHLAAISLYISHTSPLYANRMVERLLHRVEALAEFPELGVPVSESEHENVRELVEPPYRILYLAQPTRIDVLAIVHGRQEINWPA